MQKNLNKKEILRNLKNNNNKLSKNIIANDLRKLGIDEGASVLFKVDLTDLILKDIKVVDYIVSSFLKAVGNRGTIASAAYTKSYPLNLLNDSHVFNKKSRSTSGTFSNLLF